MDSSTCSNLNDLDTGIYNVNNYDGKITNVPFPGGSFMCVVAKQGDLYKYLLASVEGSLATKSLINGSWSSWAYYALKSDCALKTEDNGYSGRNLYYTSSNIGKDSWAKAPILISSKNPNNGQRAQIGFENQGINAGVLWLDTNGELHFTDQAGMDHVVAWKG